ncbi:MAG: LysR family transcriptional regulator, partial [Solobacterium sp.]|nr:LysR family transcriptional regulator [Solobacterium sp.]
MLDPKIKTLLKVVETGNYTQAAKALNLTQPAVSQHIKALETEL